MRIEIEILELGSVELPHGHPRAATGTCTIHGAVVRHPDGVIVFDTGTADDHPIVNDLYRPTVVPLVEALHGVGVDERDVVAIVNSHLHFDHCGQNRLVDAPVWVTQAELDVSTTDFYTVPEWAAIEPERLRIAADGESIAEGVSILHTPGHTPGHLSLTVVTDVGLEIIVGQACYTCAEFRSGTTTVADMHSPEWHAAGLDSLARLSALRPDRAHFGHDAETFMRTGAL